MNPVTLGNRLGCYTDTMNQDSRESGLHNLSLGVIEALQGVDVKALSYVQLRRLYAALVEAGNTVDAELATRSEATNSLGETVRIQAPVPEAPSDD